MLYSNSLVGFKFIRLIILKAHIYANSNPRYIGGHFQRKGCSNYNEQATIRSLPPPSLSISCAALELHAFNAEALLSYRCFEFEFLLGQVRLPHLEAAPMLL
jgi:hypothetical protein